MEQHFIIVPKPCKLSVCVCVCPAAVGAPRGPPGGLHRRRRGLLYVLPADEEDLLQHPHQPRAPGQVPDVDLSHMTWTRVMILMTSAST